MTVKTWVEIDGRRFVVFSNAAGVVLYIKERKAYGKYPIEGVYNAPYWHHRHHKVGGSKFLVARIIEAAKAKYAAS